jgi:hypothetical protein
MALSPNLFGRLTRSVEARYQLYQLGRSDRGAARLLLHQGIDGFHEWHWGDGWVQSCLEGVSLLPLNLGQTLTLVRLKQFLATRSEA